MKEGMESNRTVMNTMIEMYYIFIHSFVQNNVFNMSLFSFHSNKKKNRRVRRERDERG